MFKNVPKNEPLQNYCTQMEIELEAGGQPSTWYPPDGLVELPLNHEINQESLKFNLKKSRQIQKSRIFNISPKSDGRANQ